MSSIPGIIVEMKKYWLIKSEPETYGIDHLMAEGVTPWSGIRNYQARNFMRDDMQIGDLCLFYHSNAKPQDIGVIGIAEVASAPYEDKTAHDPKSDYFEPNKKIRWDLVDMKFVKKFKRIVTLNEMKIDPKLAHMLVIKRGMRLSIQPVRKEDFDYLVKLASK